MIQPIFILKSNQLLTDITRVQNIDECSHITFDILYDDIVI